MRGEMSEGNGNEEKTREIMYVKEGEDEERENEEMKWR